MDFFPRLIQIQRDDADEMSSPQREPGVEVKAVCGVKQDAPDRFPSADGGLIGEVSVQLIEKIASETLGSKLPC